MGNALITTDSGAIPEIVDETSALFVERGERMVESLCKAIIKLYDEPETRINITEAAFQRVNFFTRDNYNKKLFTLIEEVF